MQEDNIAIRLKFLISELGINSSVFADNCGISRATLSQLLTGRNKKMSDVLIGQIHKAYPNLSILWLLFNEGNMWVHDTGESVDKDNGSSDNNTSPNSSANGSAQPLFGNRDSDEAEGGFSQSSNAKFPSEILNFPDDGRQANKYSEERSLNPTENGYQNISAQQISSYANTAGLISEIENLRSKIKKVVQITIYYDDSTFETFYPK